MPTLQWSKKTPAKPRPLFHNIFIISISYRIIIFTDSRNRWIFFWRNRTQPEVLLCTGGENRITLYAKWLRQHQERQSLDEPGGAQLLLFPAQRSPVLPPVWITLHTGFLRAFMTQPLITKCLDMSIWPDQQWNIELDGLRDWVIVTGASLCHWVILSLAYSPLLLFLAEHWELIILCGLVLRHHWHNALLNYSWSLSYINMRL